MRDVENVCDEADVDAFGTDADVQVAEGRGMGRDRSRDAKERRHQCRECQQPVVKVWLHSTGDASSTHPNAGAALGTRRWLRCSSLKYSRYSRSSRLASEAPRPSRCDARLSPRAASGFMRRARQW